MPVVLHVSPHPDDEVLGCGAALLALRDAGWRVVNLACGLGRPADHERRRAELAAALDRLGFEGVVAEPPVALGAGDDLVAATARVAGLVADTVARVGADLVVSPQPGDGHHGHEAVGRAVASLGGLVGTAFRWWAWGLWRDLPDPTLYVPYGTDRLASLVDALRCHAGEVARNAYDDLLAARGRVQAVLGSERVFGYGSPAASAASAASSASSVVPYADLLAEWLPGPSGSGWVPGPRRVLDPSDPLGPGPSDAAGSYCDQ